MKVKLTITVEIPDNLYDFNDKSEVEFLMNTVLKENLLLHSNEIGDTVGSITEVENIQLCK